MGLKDGHCANVTLSGAFCAIFLYIFDEAMQEQV